MRLSELKQLINITGDVFNQKFEQFEPGCLSILKIRET